MNKHHASGPKKPLYGTQGRLSAERPPEITWEPKPRHCALCGLHRPGEWYELMREGWVCDTCRPEATHIERPPPGQIEKPQIGIYQEANREL